MYLQFYLLYDKLRNSVIVNMESLNCGYKLIIWLSVSTNHHKWLSTGVFLCTPIDNHFLRYRTTTENAKNIEKTCVSLKEHVIKWTYYRKSKQKIGCC